MTTAEAVAATIEDVVTDTYKVGLAWSACAEAKGRPRETVIRRINMDIEGLIARAAACETLTRFGQRQLLLAVMGFADCWESYLKSLEYRFVAPTTVSDLNRRFNEVIRTRDAVDADEPPLPALESVTELVGNEVPYQTIAAIYGTPQRVGPFYENKIPQKSRIEEEAENPGTWLKDFEDPRLLARSKRAEAEAHDLCRLKELGTAAAVRLTDLQQRH